MLETLHQAVLDGNKNLVSQILASSEGKALVNQPDETGRTALMLALKPEKAILPTTVLAIINDLLAHGADANYRDKHGYDALINAVYGCGEFSDAELMDLFGQLIAHGAPLDGKTDWNEKAARVLSRAGRFQLVQYLLKAGANPDDVRFTPLIEIILYGSLENLDAALKEKPDLEERDYWERTAFLIAVDLGSIEKAALLLEAGADPMARGRCAKPALHYAAENGDAAMLEWLLTLGVDVDTIDQFGTTALRAAIEEREPDAIKILIAAGADVNHASRSGTILSYADTRDTAMLLLEAGADPQHLSRQGIRSIIGFDPEPNPSALDVTETEFQQGRARRFGTQNPEVISDPFLKAMIRSGVNAYQAAKKYVGEERKLDAGYKPIWCADRFGQSLTFLPHGKIVQIGGEHEDHYDPDFCIYNDVFLYASDDENPIIYGYPESDFPPTDFHTATLIGNSIFIIGALGYKDKRLYGETPVYRLDLNSFQIEKVVTSGTMPGWIYKHRTVLTPDNNISVSGGTILSQQDEQEVAHENSDTFILSTASWTWKRI